MRGRQQMRDTLLPGDPADEGDDGTAEVHAQIGQHRLARHRLGRIPDLGVDSVAHDVDSAGIDGRVHPQHVGTHPRADGDHRFGRVHRGLLDPRRDPVAAAELLGLPRPQRLQRMRGQHMRYAVQQRREMPGHPGVPGVAVHDGGLRGGAGHHQVRRQGRQRRVRAAQLGVGLIGERPRPRRAHAVHVDLAQTAQLRDELGHVYPGPAVDLRRILPSHHRHAHTRHRSSRRRTPQVPTPRRHVNLVSSTKIKFFGGQSLSVGIHPRDLAGVRHGR